MNVLRLLTWTMAAALVASLLVASPALAGKDYKGFARGDALITPKALKAMMDADDPKLVLIGVVKGGLTGSFTMGHMPRRLRRMAAGLHGREGQAVPVRRHGDERRRVPGVRPESGYR